LLIGTGSGLAPLYGIARDALHQGHRGLIRLYHGSRAAAGLYLGDDLNHLAAAHPNFHYEPCISGASSVSGRDPVAALDRAMRDQPDLSGWRVYLCGNPQMVEAARLATFLAGAASSDILADPFLPTGTAPTQSAISP
jgi:ferredoxin-NADP reductase